MTLKGQEISSQLLTGMLRYMPPFLLEWSRMRTNGFHISEVHSNTLRDHAIICGILSGNTSRTPSCWNMPWGFSLAVSMLSRLLVQLCLLPHPHLIPRAEPHLSSYSLSQHLFLPSLTSRVPSLTPGLCLAQMFHSYSVFEFPFILSMFPLLRSSRLQWSSREESWNHSCFHLKILFISFNSCTYTYWVPLIFRG